MNKNSIAACVCIVLFALSLWSCSDDKGNYSYSDINELTFSGIEEEYTVRTGENMTIIPVIETSLQGNEENYTYEWILMGATINGVYRNERVWSRLKEWDDVALKLPAGTYRFYYRVTDGETGVKWFSDNFRVKIENDISQGFFILSDINGTGRLDFINFSSNTFDLKLDVLTSIGTELPPLEKPLGVVCVVDVNSPYLGASGNKEPVSVQYMAAILTESGAYRLHPADLSYINDYNLLNNILVSNYMPNGFYIKDVFHKIPGSTSTSEAYILDNNNNLYQYYATSNFFWTFGTYLNITQANQPITISPLCAVSSTAGPVAYDIVNKSFVRNTANNLRYMSYYAASSETLFKFNNTGMDLIYLHTRSVVVYEGNKTGVYYAILKDPLTNEYFYGFFRFDGAQYVYFKIDTTTLPGWENIKEYVMTYNNDRKGLGDNFLFYRTDKNIYQFNISDKSYDLVYTAPGNNLISKMDFIKPNVTFQDRMMICTYDPTLPAESCGTLEVMEIENATYGRLIPKEHNGEVMKWTGFGKIIDLDWKFK